MAASLKLLLPVFPKPKWHKRDKILAFGFLLPVTAFGLFLTLSDLGRKPNEAENRQPSNAKRSSETPRTLSETKRTEGIEAALTAAPQRLNENDRAELLALFKELEEFRRSPEFLEYGFSKQGKSEWAHRVESLRERSEREDPYYETHLTPAAINLRLLGGLYITSKGQETDTTHSVRESLEKLISRM